MADALLRRERAVTGWRDRFGAAALPLMTAAALVLVVAGAGLLWAAGGPGSRQILVTQLLINIVLVMGLQVFIGNAGILSFGHLAFGSIAGYTVALLTVPAMRKTAVIPAAPWGLSAVELDPVVATLIAVAVTIVVGAVVGLAVVQVAGLAATIITLALLFGVHEIAVNWQDLTGGGGGLPFVPRLDGITTVVVAAVGAVVVARWFRLTRAGRWSQAGQSDRIAAASSGIDVRWSWLLAFLLSVVLVAIGASLRVQSLGSISPNFFYFNLTLVTLAMLIVGGRRSVTGALFGVVVITVGNEATRFLAAGEWGPALGWLLRPGLSDLFLGGAMVGFMVLRPQGLLGDRELDQWLARRWHRFRGTVPRVQAAAPPAPLTTPDAPPSATREGVAPTEAARRAVEEVVSLEVEGISVAFGGFRALREVTLEARTDEVVGLIGPNGAGKTTLLNVMTGLVPPDAGRVRLAAQELTAAAPAQIARAGLARTFQNLRVFADLPVRENVLVAAMASDRYRVGRPQPDPDALLRAAGLWEQRDRYAGELDYGAQRRLEIARAAALAPWFLLLDEPTSGMSDTESAEMVRHVRATAMSIGAGVLVIDHDLHFITSICDRIVVLDHGMVIASGTPAEIQGDRAVIEAYLGTRATAPDDRTS